MAIKNCEAFIYWHVKDFETAIEKFEEVISFAEKLEKPVRRDEAKFLNNLTHCIIQYV